MKKRNRMWLRFGKITSSMFAVGMLGMFVFMAKVAQKELMDYHYFMVCFLCCILFVVFNPEIIKRCIVEDD